LLPGKLAELPELSHVLPYLWLVHFFSELHQLRRLRVRLQRMYLFIGLHQLHGMTRDANAVDGSVWRAARHFPDQLFNES
jgi:hypothetical protein